MLKRTLKPMKRTPLARKTPLARGPGPARSGPLKPLSQKQAASRKQVNKLCPLTTACLACGTTQQLTRSHVLTQKMHPRHAANPQNVITLCWPDHCIWENNKARFKELYPAAWAAKMQAMRDLEPQYFSQFQVKNPTLF